MSATLLCALCLLLFALPAHAQQTAPKAAEQPSILTPEEQQRRKDTEEAELARKRALESMKDQLKVTPLHKTLGWRVGPTFHGMWSSLQGRPFIYPSFGWRYKPGDLYVDLQAPFIAAIFDAGIWAIQDQLLGLREPFSFFETINEAQHYAFIEVSHLRVGQSINFRLGKSEDREGVPFSLNLGVVGIADWVVFEARQLGRALEDLDDLQDEIDLDPFVVGAGGFVGVMATAGIATVDLNLEIAPDLYSPSDSYTDQSGWVFGADLEVLLTITDNFGMVLRARHSLYTHLPDLNLWTTSVNTGIILGF